MASYQYWRPCGMQKSPYGETHEAKENVWKVLSQPWSALPLSVEGLKTNFAVDMPD